MMFIATVSAYDCMESVAVAATVYLAPDQDSPNVQRVYHASVTVQGTGEEDPRRWLRDALVALAEAQ